MYINKKRVRKPVRKGMLYMYMAMILLSAIIFIISISSIISIKEEKYSYDSKIESKYKVNMKENKNIEVDMNEGIYIRDLTENIKIDFDYLYKGTDKLNVHSKYTTYTTLVVQTIVDGQKQIIFEKNYDLEEKEIEEQKKEQKISKSVYVDVNKYNQIVEDLKIKYGISLSAYLNVEFDITTKLQDEKNESKNKSVIKIGLLDRVNKIEKVEDKQKNNIIYKEYTTSNKKGYMISSICLIIGILGIGYVVFGTKEMKLQKDSYKAEKYRILRGYGDRIVSIKNNLEINKNINIIEVISFEEIAKVADELWQPILYFDDIDKKELCYYVMTDTIMYMFKQK